VPPERNGLLKEGAIVTTSSRDVIEALWLRQAGCFPMTSRSWRNPATTMPRSVTEPGDDDRARV
jgi:DNA processing protein